MTTDDVPDPEADASVDVISVARFWKTIAEKKRDFGKQSFLSDPGHIETITARMKAANELLADGKTDEAHQIFHLFREVFYGEKELDDWLEYAKDRLQGDTVEMPVPRVQTEQTDADDK